MISPGVADNLPPFSGTGPGARPSLCRVPPQRSRRRVRPRRTRRVKNKNAVQVKPHTAREANAFHADTASRKQRQNPPLAWRAGMSYNIPCGAALGPLCRWLGTCAGLRVLLHPRAAAFLFFVLIIAGISRHCKIKNLCPSPFSARSSLLTSAGKLDKMPMIV